MQQSPRIMQYRQEWREPLEVGRGNSQGKENEERGKLREGGKRINVKNQNKEEKREKI